MALDHLGRAARGRTAAPSPPRCGHLRHRAAHVDVDAAPPPPPWPRPPPPPSAAASPPKSCTQNGRSDAACARKRLLRALARSETRRADQLGGGKRGPQLAGHDGETAARSRPAMGARMKGFASLRPPMPTGCSAAARAIGSRPRRCACGSWPEPSRASDLSRLEVREYTSAGWLLSQLPLADGLEQRIAQAPRSPARSGTPSSRAMSVPSPAGSLGIRASALRSPSIRSPSAVTLASPPGHAVRVRRGDVGLGERQEILEVVPGVLGQPPHGAVAPGPSGTGSAAGGPR